MGGAARCGNRDWRRERASAKTHFADVLATATEGVGAAASSSKFAAPPTEEEGATQSLRYQEVTSSRGVQHVGAWLMLAMVHRLGVYDASQEACTDESTKKVLRIALDAFVCALVLGEGCVERVRRLQTPSGHALCARRAHLRRHGCVASSEHSPTRTARRACTSRWRAATCVRPTPRRSAMSWSSTSTTTCGRKRARRRSARVGACRTSACDRG